MIVAKTLIVCPAVFMESRVKTTGLLVVSLEKLSKADQEDLLEQLAPTCILLDVRRVPPESVLFRRIKRYVEHSNCSVLRLHSYDWTDAELNELH